MNILLIYMVKVAVFLASFYLVYSLVLSSDTAYARNRAYILCSLVAAFILPLITFRTGKPLTIQFFGKFLSDVFVSANSIGVNDGTGHPATGLLKIIYNIYLTGLIVFLLKLLLDFSNLLFLIIRHKRSESRIIRFHGFSTSGFSAMGYIFINSRLDADEAAEIINHEQNHLRQNHFLDIVFIEIIKPFQWFNPFIYLTNSALRSIHEYQADRDCLSSGVPVANYQSLLLSQVFKSKAFSLTNSFSNPSLIKRRMLMMTRKPTSALANVKMLMVLPVAGLIFLAISAYKEVPALPPPPPPPPVEARQELVADPSEETPYVAVEQMPMYPGGDAELLKYIGQNTRYPETAKQQGTQGRVIVKFCVTSKGGVSQISILKGVDPELDAEAIRVVSSLPAFQPGMQGGKAVPVWYMVPITFTLR